MKNTSQNTSVSEVAASSYTHEENPWPSRLGWVAIILLVGTLICAAIIFSLPASQELASDKESIPEALATSLKQGTLLFELGQLDAAETLYLQMIDNFPDHPQGFNNLAALYALRGDLDQARSLLEKAMATDAKYTAIYRNLGTIYAELARDSYGRALQLEPVDIKTQLQILDTQGTAQLVAAESPPVIIEPVQSQPDEEIIAAKVEPTVVVVEQATETVATPATAVVPPVATEPALSATPEKSEPSSPTPLVAVTEKIEQAAPSKQQESPQEFLHRWAAAWTAQDADAYFASYAGDYIPRNYKTRNEWMKKRHSRIVGPAFIEIALANIEVLSESEDQVRIELTQSYSNDRFQDKVRKRFELVRQDQSWVIASERSLGSTN